MFLNKYEQKQNIDDFLCVTVVQRRVLCPVQLFRCVSLRSVSCSEVCPVFKYSCSRWFLFPGELFRFITCVQSVVQRNVLCLVQLFRGTSSVLSLFRGMSCVQSVVQSIVQMPLLCPVNCSKECLTFGTVVQRCVCCPVNCSDASLVSS